MPGEVAASAKIEDDSAGHDRDNLTRSTNRVADPRLEEPLHHPVGGRKPEGTSARQHDGVNPLDEVARVKGIGLSGAGSTSANVNPGNGAAFGGQDHRGTGQPAVNAAIGMAHPDAGHVGQAVGGGRVAGRSSMLSSDGSC